MGIAGGLRRVETRITPPSGRPFRFEKSTLFPRPPRVDGSERGGPRLPGPGSRTAPGEPPRPNRLGLMHLPRPNPILPPRAVAAGTGSTSSLKGGHPGETSVDVCAHGGIVVTEARVCARQRPPQFPLRPYTVGQVCADGGIVGSEFLVCARHARRNSHCAPTR